MEHAYESDFVTMSNPRRRPTESAVPSDSPWWNPQRSSTMPFGRYLSAYDRVDVPLTERVWPSRRIDRAPLWVPVDLRDGNQALPEPMSPARKLRAFELQVALGFKEIEVGYPSASALEFEFVRTLAESDVVPDDVTVVVFTPALPDLIDRTVAAVSGLRRVVLHLCVATAPTWRDVVYRVDRDTLLRRILDGGRRLMLAADTLSGTSTRFQFSPEAFNLTEPEFAIDVCNAMTELWDASLDRPVIHNLPSTVEIATPNVFADQVEWMDRHLARRDAVILSIHPHNDRGTAVASAELALLAGAQRVEGCLFGNGERTGNVDLVTLALNLFSQGVDPQLDLSDLDGVRRVVEECNGISVPERYPYAGELVYTAFSGTHQDAIRKGLDHHDAEAVVLGVPPGSAHWNVPYLPVDPADIGRNYEAVIRVTSQSGKGGIAYLMSSVHGLRLPQSLQKEFSSLVQAESESAAAGGEVSADRLMSLFAACYSDVPGAVGFSATSWLFGEGEDRVQGVADVGGVAHAVAGRGSSPARAVSEALAAAGVDVRIVDEHEHGVDAGTRFAAYVQVGRDGVTRWGAALAAGRRDAMLRAVVSAVNRLEDVHRPPRRDGHSWSGVAATSIGGAER